MLLCPQINLKMKKHNFSAGPSILPQEVMQKAAQAVVELDNSGLSLIEISHRSPAFIEIMEKATSLAIELLGLQGKGYKAMFLQGGASQQFLNVANNFLETKAGYANTGTWSTKAIKEAKLLGEVVELSSSKDANFNYIPKGFDIEKPEPSHFFCASICPSRWIHLSNCCFRCDNKWIVSNCSSNCLCESWCCYG